MKRIIAAFSLYIILTYSIQAQCAMCKGTVESNQKEDVQKAENKAKGLNTGILYLMVIPYIAIGSIAYLWYRNSKSETAKQAKIDTALDKLKSAY